jgi:hypothetical protein
MAKMTDFKVKLIKYFSIKILDREIKGAPMKKFQVIQF